jgi:hypothetical protein
MAGAYEEAVLPISLNAAEDYSQPTDDSPRGLNRFATIAGQAPGEFIRASNANYGQIVGVLLTKPPEGQPGRIGNKGIVPVELGATLAAGALVTSGADGRAVASASNPAAAALLEGGDEGTIVAALLK